MRSLDELTDSELFARLRAIERYIASYESLRRRGVGVNYELTNARHTRELIRCELSRRA
jgi:hypothetical protein